MEGLLDLVDLRRKLLFDCGDEDGHMDWGTRVDEFEGDELNGKCGCDGDAEVGDEVCNYVDEVGIKLKTEMNL